MEKTFPYIRKCPFTPADEYADLMANDLTEVTLHGSGLRIWTVAN